MKPFKYTKTGPGPVEFVLGAIILISVLTIAWAVVAPKNGATLLVSSATAASPVARLRMCERYQKNTSTKTCLVDGDTIWVAGVKYRLEAFDTPEPQTDICGGDAEVALAHKASARLLELLNSNVWTMTTGGIDGTGSRTLATIRINGQDVGDILIAERLARRWPDGPEFWC